MYKNIALVVSLLLAGIAFTTSAQTATVTIEGEVLHPLALTVKDLSAYKTIQVRAKDHSGKDRNYKGVSLYEVLLNAGVTLGDQLKGKNLTKYIRIHAIDGYEVVFALPEIDPIFTDHVVMLAYEVDGTPLPADEGPFRIVVPEEKKHARWIRQIASIKILYAKD